MSAWNNLPVQEVGHRAKGTLNDFQKFILRGNVVDLAVGIVIGAAFTSVVTCLCRRYYHATDWNFRQD